MDAGGRATHGAVAENARAENRVGNNGRDVQVSREGTSPWAGEGTSPRMDEVERSTTAWTQEVEQRMEQLPRKPEPRTMHDSRDEAQGSASVTGGQEARSDRRN